MLGMPARTPWDLNFRLLGIPVRISPWFWLVAILLGLNGVDKGNVTGLLIWVACVFASILIHEFGHGLTARSFGFRPEIALYQMGGLCASESDRQTPGQRFAVLWGGPGSQFVLLGLVCLLGWAILGIGLEGDFALAKNLLGLDHSLHVKVNPASWLSGKAYDISKILFSDLFQINLLWPLLNLLPIFPLDGGQITQVVMTKVDPRNGPRRVHIVSMVVAGVLAAYVLISANRSERGGGGGIFMGFFFASFALLNYQMLQAYHRSYSDSGRDDADWWKR